MTAVSELPFVQKTIATPILFKNPVATDIVFNPKKVCTRFYLPYAGQPHVTPSYDSAWDVTTNSVERFLPLVKSPTGTASTSDVAANFSKSAAAVQDVAHAQFVSEPIDAQTISGNARIIVRGGENVSNQEAHLQCIIRVVSNDGTTVRGTLYSGYTGALLPVGNNGSGMAREFNTATQNRVASMLLTPVTALAGDRLVVEVGQRFTDAASATGAGYLVLGDLSTHPDQDYRDDAFNGSGQIPWIEFGNGVQMLKVISDFYADPNGTAIPARDIVVPEGVTSTHDGLVVFAVNSQTPVTWTVTISGSGTITQVDSIAGSTAYFHIYKVTGATAGDVMTLSTNPSSRCIAVQSRWEKGINYGTVASAVRVASVNTTTSGSTTPAVGQRVLVVQVDRTATNAITSATSSGGETVQFESYDRIDTTQPVMGIYFGEFVASAAAARTATVVVTTAAGSGYCAVIPISVVVGGGPVSGAPSVRDAGAWSKTTLAKAKATGSFADTMIRAKVSGTFTGV